MKAKQILSEILDAHCLYSENRRKVIKLANLNSQDIFNGQNDYYQVRNTILNNLNDDKAAEIVNAIPFPFIEEYSPIEDKTQKSLNNLTGLIDYYKRDSFFWIENVLLDIPVNARIQSTITLCGVQKKIKEQI